MTFMGVVGAKISSIFINNSESFLATQDMFGFIPVSLDSLIESMYIQTLEMD